VSLVRVHLSGWNKVGRIGQYDLAKTDVRTYVGKKSITDVISSGMVMEKIENFLVRNSLSLPSYFESNSTSENNVQAVKKLIESRHNGNIPVDILDEIKSAVQFAVRQETARHDWPESFTSSIDARNPFFQWQATYIVVWEKDPISGKKRTDKDTVAVMRIIRRPYQVTQMPEGYKINSDFYVPLENFYAQDNERDLHISTYVNPLPGEQYLHDQLPTSYLSIKQIEPLPMHWSEANSRGEKIGFGMLFEPGLWAIRKDMNVEGFAETVLHFCHAFLEFSKQSNGDSYLDGRGVLTYGDEISTRLYKKMGFTILEPAIEKSEIHNGTKVMKKWWRLYMNSQGVLNLMQNLTRLNSGISDSESLQLQNTLEALLKESQSIYSLP
jgi:hypothetical protein